tara:strand:+ start:278 stop:457 length:180 start_codon:yes stop_codon:yes gene_type:complete
MKLVEHQDLVVGVQEHLDQPLYIAQIKMMDKQEQLTLVVAVVDQNQMIVVLVELVDQEL